MDNPRFKDKTSITFWADNCTAQNKNWTLFSGLVHYINQSNLLETLTIKFFEKGHTFNAADSFHAAVENAMKHKGKMYDFTDFIEVINTHGISVEMYQQILKNFEMS